MNEEEFTDEELMEVYKTGVEIPIASDKEIEYFYEDLGFSPNEVKAFHKKLLSDMDIDPSDNNKPVTRVR